MPSWRRTMGWPDMPWKSTIVQHWLCPLKNNWRWATPTSTTPRHYTSSHLITLHHLVVQSVAINHVLNCPDWGFCNLIERVNNLKQCKHDVCNLQLLSIYTLSFVSTYIVLKPLNLERAYILLNHVWCFPHPDVHHLHKEGHRAIWHHTYQGDIWESHWSSPRYWSKV